MKAAAIIPARLGSTRFPEKPLAMLGGKCLITRVWEAVVATELFDEVIVATDSKRILDVVLAAGGKAQMTSSEHPSGSDRVAEVASGLEADIIVNVQGDEPFITEEVLKPLLDSFLDDAVQMASLMTPILDAEQLDDPGIVKVVTDAAGKALYFSRSLIPFDRDGASGYNYMRHIGVYAWRRETLLSFVALPVGRLERVEKLEQLRALENGIAIRMVETDYQGIGIDTPEDLEKAERIIK
ncbi:MAG TPA: 3-deoxy-manno-octulosonate cytidylyltransferase [Candidatus Cloacimonas sp.]|jgi:3-deoxy-manno-octulosonate cytidylyltransferase (CMP-KDO synthetase)|nr:3-deoxy-manno-octulosonate cytidylyltransferase [Candidatus Cloacimonas sp.]